MIKNLLKKFSAIDVENLETLKSNIVSVVVFFKFLYKNLMITAKKITEKNLSIKENIIFSMFFKKITQL